MFAPQWDYNEYESFPITDEYIRDAVEKAEIKDLDIKANKGPVFQKCAGDFSILDDMIVKGASKPPFLSI